MADTSSDLLGEQLLTETMRSERVRARLLAAIAAFLTIMLLVADVASAPVVEAMRETGAFVWMLVLSIGLLCYELLIYSALGRLLRKKRRIPLGVRYWNSFVEVSVPSVAMIIFAWQVDPLLAPVSLAPYVYFLFIILSTLRLEFWLCLFTGSAAAVQYMTISAIIASKYQTTGSTTLDLEILSPTYFVGKGVLLVLAGLAAGFVTDQVKKRLVSSLKTVEERNQIVRMFGEHVAPAVVNELLNNSANIRTSRKYVSVMFVDIRGYTTYAEKREPEEVVEYLNRVYEIMIEIVNEHHGIVHQLLGDGMMAIFGAPLSHGNDADNAVNAGLRIIKRLEDESASGKIPKTRVGIGIHAGEVVAGTVGTPLHKEYKVTGDAVNLAARIEQLNKEFNSHLLVSGEVWRTIDGSSVRGKALGSVDIKGRTEPVEIHQLL